MELPPLLFEPLLKPKVWGGRTLESLGKALPPGELIGESWELADLPDSIAGGKSIVRNGPLQGLTLAQAINRHRDAIMGPASLSPQGGFPLLIKYLDARQNLSVQVHPDLAYAHANPGAHLKSEAWVIIAADPGAVIYKGLKAGVTPESFARHIRENSVLDDLVAVPAVAGECHYLPSGTCHALGAGVLVAEVQTPSDTTFRVYDWGRTGPGRDLHIDAALACIAFGEHQAVHASPKKTSVTGGIRITPLTATEYFTIDRVDAVTAACWPMEEDREPEVWMMISGEGQFQDTGKPPVQLRSGTTALRPASTSHHVLALEAGAWLLRVRLPRTIDA